MKVNIYPIHATCFPLVHFRELMPLFNTITEPDYYACKMLCLGMRDNIEKKP